MRTAFTRKDLFVSSSMSMFLTLCATIKMARSFYASKVKKFHVSHLKETGVCDIKSPSFIELFVVIIATI